MKTRPWYEAVEVLGASINQGVVKKRQNRTQYEVAGGTMCGTPSHWALAFRALICPIGLV